MAAVAEAAGVTVRPADPSDAEACAAILNDWIDATPWMTRVHARAAVARHYRDDVLPHRRVWVVGRPVAGFLALDEAAGLVTALYLAAHARGAGLGRALLDAARAGRDRLRLWTFEANGDAHRFYERAGFRLVDRTAGDNEEGLPDRLYEWRRP